tara:strand:- start:1885 stop:2349 length:465 start_codon:yes stop_codon:yes gene_type:complete
MNTTTFEFRNMCDIANSLYTHTLPVECMSYLHTPVVDIPNMEVFCNICILCKFLAQYFSELLLIIVLFYLYKLQKNYNKLVTFAKTTSKTKIVKIYPSNYSLTLENAINSIRACVEKDARSSKKITKIEDILLKIDYPERGIYTDYSSDYDSEY